MKYHVKSSLSKHLRTYTKQSEQMLNILFVLGNFQFLIQPFNLILISSSQFIQKSICVILCHPEPDRIFP